ncbi:MAG TPA: helicase-exonuclease AddAB subunit AddA [Tepidisphaeraceae bacterium]|nr:helicase-exonuclease AddAB subunit AddA [Tepidisphaeraceae bacterium]
MKHKAPAKRGTAPNRVAKPTGAAAESLFPMEDRTTVKPPASAARGWTPQQLDAIRTCDRSVLVSAAAGSGKTAVLAERCVHLVCDASPACDVDELLVVTFTEAAAAEMRLRIQQSLRQRLEASDEARLLKQLALIDHAQVSTLHGFCARLCRQHFHLLELDPGFEILGGDESELMRAEIARELFSDRYESNDAAAFHAFIDAYGDGNDERLVRKVIATHELLASLLDPDGWLAAARRRLDEALAGELRQSELGRELETLVRRRLAELTRRCDAALATVARMGGFGKYLAALNETRQVLVHLRETLDGDGGIDAIAEVVRDLKFPSMPPVSAGTAGKEFVQGLLKGLRAELTDEKSLLASILRFDTRQWVDGLRAIRPHVDVFLGLVEEFGQRYGAAKRAARAVDFADLERLSLRALRDSTSPGLAPSAIARLQHRRFKHVLVDEYQDINEVQDAILRLVSRECIASEGECGNLFTVGDVKQSIYRFRLAEPARFLERDEQFRATGAAGTVIDLQANFRSRGPLLAALNRVFATLMTRQAADIEYDASHELRAGVTYPDGDGISSFRGAPIELHVLPMHASTSADDDDPDSDDAEADPPDRTAREAVLIARRIREIMGADASAGRRMQVFERSATGTMAPRDIRYSDIVILLRSMKFKADQYADVLRQSGIPVHSESGTGYFESMEVRDMLALLALLDNQRQDVPLAGVLRGPLAALPEPEDSLARIRLAYSGDVAFHQAVVRYASEQHDELAAKLTDFLEQLKRWRVLSQRRPLAEVLWTIYQETGYLAFCAGLLGGEQRVANLIDLHERARQFGSFQKQGLARFLNFLEQLRDQSDLGQPSVASAADDVVRIMSVHSSKGLEFPVVILPDLGKRINLSDCSGSILIDRHAGAGVSVADEARRIRYPSLASMLVQTRLRQQSLAEELRVLYVAMTRAREHLILIGTCRDSACQTWATRWAGHAGALPADVVLGACTMLDWLGPVAAATASLAEAPIHLTQHTADDVAAWPSPEDLRPRPSPRLQQLIALQPLDPPPPPNAQAEAIAQRLTFQRPHAPFADVAAAASVSDLSKHGRFARVGCPSSRGLVAFDRVLPAPRIASIDVTSTATDIGTAHHLVLQHLDFSRPCDPPDVHGQIARLVQRRLITPAVQQIVDAEAIAWFAATPLGRTLRKHASTLRRELPIYFPREPEAPDGSPLASADPMDRVMIRSRIDVLVEADAGLELVDYKTDAITTDALAARVDFYRPQMDLYRRAVSSATGRPVGVVHLVFLAAREVASFQSH